MSTTASTSSLDEHDALPAGTRFGELEVLRVLGVGGFGIVYLAQDHALERLVALKEYMPSSLAGRGKGGYAVSVRSGAHSETYALGLRSFVNEARLLARFNHPSLVKVYRFWEQNGTAYMVMPYLEGRTLRDVRRSMNVPPTEPWIRSVIDPLLDALELLHGEDVYHRDIAPDNILLPPGEVPVLLDFGAARRAIGDRTQTFTAILKPSYAPIEQYAEALQLRQGPWTDLYALGAVVYYLLRGTPPPPATARAVQDDVRLLTQEDNPDISPAFLDAIEWAMSVRPVERPQSIAALREVIEGRAKVPPRGRAATTTLQRTVVMPRANPTTSLAPTTSFAPTMPADQVEAAQAAMEATRPMTVPPGTERDDDRHTTYPPVGARTAPPAVPVPAEPKTTRPPAMERSRPDDTTVMPATATREPQPLRRRGAWMLASAAALVGVGAMAAWMAGGRPSSAPDAIGPAAAAVIEQPAALANPATALGAAPAASAVDPIEALINSKEKAATRTAAARPAASRDPAPRPAEAPVAVHHAATHREEPVRPAPVDKPSAAETSTPAPQVQAAAAAPRDACGSRVFLSLAVCMEEQCERPRFKNHPQCERVRAIVERRRRGENGG